VTYDVPSRSLKNSLESRTARYQNQLPGSPGESLLLGRGLDPETIEHFRLGYVADAHQGDEAYKGRISIPYLTVSGVVALRYRQVEQTDRKYLNQSGCGHRPYNVSSLAPFVILTEGEPDTWICHQMGFKAVAIPGADTWNPVWARLFRFRKVVMFADGDDPGKKLAAIIKKDVHNLAVIHMPYKKDVNDMFLERGRQYFVDLLKDL
jgi:DNA primase